MSASNAVRFIFKFFPKKTCLFSCSRLPLELLTTPETGEGVVSTSFYPTYVNRYFVRRLAGELNPCSHPQFNICSRFYGTPLKNSVTLDRVILKRPIRCLVIRPSHWIVPRLYPSDGCSAFTSSKGSGVVLCDLNLTDLWFSFFGNLYH